MVSWIKQSPKTAVRKSPVLTITRRGFRLSAEFGRAVFGKKFCEIFVASDDRHIGIKFHEQAGDDTYTVGFDGGGKTKSADGKFIACKNVMDNSETLRAIAERPLRERKISMSEGNGMWVGAIIPFFTFNVDSRLPEDDEIGVYRLLSEKDIVYIGQGLLKRRIREHSTNGLIYDSAEYFVSNNKKEAEKMESLYIEDFIRQHDKLPLYNRVRGISNE